MKGFICAANVVALVPTTNAAANAATVVFFILKASNKSTTKNFFVAFRFLEKIFSLSDRVSSNDFISQIFLKTSQMITQYFGLVKFFDNKFQIEFVMKKILWR